MTATETKTYSSKSNVRRAMKPQVEGQDYEIVALGAGQFTARSLTVKEVEKPVDPVKEATNAQVDSQAKKVAAEKKSTGGEVAQRKGGDVDVHGKSTADKPTKLVHSIAEMMHKENPKVRRKDVIDACVKAGVAFYTARTQYQQWYQQQKG